MLTRKPVSRFMPVDWEKNNDAVKKTSDDTRGTSRLLREESALLRHEV